MSRSITWSTLKNRRSERARRITVTDHANDSLFCREKAFSANPLLRTSLVFVEAELAERLVALHALFASVELAVSAVHDEEVALRKLAWWREELGSRDRSGSRHPVIRELRRCNASGRLSPDRAVAWLEDAMSRVDAVAPASKNELVSLCLKMGEPLVEMELAVAGCSSMDVDELSGLSARKGLTQLLRETARNPGDDALWWWPLEMLARDGRTRADLIKPGDPAHGRSSIPEVLNLFLAEFPAFTDISKDISFKKQKVNNLFIQDVLVGRKLIHTKKSSYVACEKALESPGFRDVLSAWKTARRLNRLK